MSYDVVTLISIFRDIRLSEWLEEIGEYTKVVDNKANTVTWQFEDSADAAAFKLRWFRPF